MIDTVYEYAGFTLAGKIHAILWGVGLPLILALAGVAYTIHTVTEKGSIKPLALHFLYLILAAWLLSPTKQQGMDVPRFLSYLGRAAGVVQKRAATAIQKDFLTAPFEWERIAAMVSFGRITEVALEERIHRFLDSCAKVALATGGPPAGNLFRPGVLPYPPECEKVRAEIWSRLERHVKENAFHRRVLEAGSRREPSKAEAFREHYVDELCARAVEAPGSPTNEAALLTAALGDYAYANPDSSTGLVGRFFQSIFGAVPLDTKNPEAVLGPAEILQRSDLYFDARQKYFLATVIGPHLFGLSIMFLAGLFPVAGLFAILPGQWRVLVNFAKVFVSVKFWPVCWAALTAFNARRAVSEVFEPPDRGTGGVYFVVAAMYFLTPAISFLIVHLATKAAALPFSQAVPPPSGSPIGPAVNVALRTLK
jgi:hypothetical protein